MGNTPSHTTKLANVDVIVTEPSEKWTVQKGITLLLPGSNITVDKYDRIRDALQGQGQVVLGYYRINVLSGASHETFARRAADVVQAYYVENNPTTLQTRSYNVVGHSVGGKIALLLATKVDPQNVRIVLAVDPVDDHPPQFTKEDQQQEGDNYSLEDKGKDTVVYMTWAAATPTGMFGINPKHNAKAIHEKNKDHVAEFMCQENASHFAYTDTCKGPLIGGGTPEGNKAAREELLSLIREKIKA